MSLVHKSSVECAKSELDLLHTPETQAMILSGKWVDYHPVALLDGDAPIEFRIAGSGDEYIDLSRTYLYAEVSFVDKDGKNLANQVLGPTNYLLHSKFASCDISLNDTLVTSQIAMYAYRSYIEMLTNYGEDAKLTHLQSALYYKDTPGQMETLETTDSSKANTGWLKRREIMGKSKTIDLFGRLHADIFFQDRYLINNVEMKIRLTRNKSSFCYIGSDDSHKIKIKKAVLYVRKAKINPEVMLAHAQIMEKTTIKYPIRRVETKVITLSSGLMNSINDNISTGALPSRVVLGLVDSDAYNGAHNKNPYNFKNYKLTKISFALDGEDVPHKAIDLDFKNDNYILGYYSLFNGMDKSISDSGNFIERMDYPSGYTLFSYDLTGDLCNGSHFNLIRSGNLRLSLTFAEALPNVVNCIIYMEYQNIIEINKNRQVLFDYTI